MIIRVEPRDWDMYTVQMFFSQTGPHAEDPEVRRYLADNSLEPRRQSEVELDGEKFQVLSFGGCYLGAHRMQAISDIQKTVVQRELLAEAIPLMLTAGAETDAHRLAAAMTDDDLKKRLACWWKNSMTTRPSRQTPRASYRWGSTPPMFTRGFWSWTLRVSIFRRTSCPMSFQASRRTGNPILMSEQAAETGQAWRVNRRQTPQIPRRPSSE